MTLADEDTNSTLVNDSIWTIPGNVAMYVAPPGGQIWQPMHYGKVSMGSVAFAFH